MNEFLKITGDIKYAKPDTDMRELTMKYIQRAKKLVDVSYKSLITLGKSCC